MTTKRHLSRYPFLLIALFGVAAGGVLAAMWPTSGEMISAEALEIVYRTPDGLVAGSDMIVVASPQKLREERVHVVSGQSGAGTRVDSVVTFKVLQVYRADGVQVDDVIESRWTRERDLPLGGSEKRVRQALPVPNFKAGETYLLFLSPFANADGSVSWGPSGSPAAARIEKDGKVVQLQSGAEEVGAIALIGFDISMLEGLVRTDDLARSEVPPPRDDVAGVSAPTRGIAFERFAANVAGLSVPEARAELSALGLDVEMATDASFCFKVEAVAREWGNLELDWGCRR